MSPEVVYYVATSLDRFIATPDGGVDWLTPYHGGEDRGFADFYRSIDALLMGSHTYEVALQLGPWRSPDKPSWVFTSRDLPVAHQSISLTAEEPARMLRTLGQQGIQRAWLMGGGRLAGSFRAAGLISHYVIAVVPVVLGGGIPLFADAPRHDSLKLTGVTSFPSGIVQLSYESLPSTEVTAPARRSTSPS